MFRVFSLENAHDSYRRDLMFTVKAGLVILAAVAAFALPSIRF